MSDWDTPPTDAELQGWDTPPTTEEMGGTPAPSPFAFRAQANTTPPDEQAEVVRQANRTGLAPSFVKDNLTKVKRQEFADLVSTFAERSPAFASHLADRPHSQALVEDDVANLEGLQWAISGKWDGGGRDASRPGVYRLPSLQVPPAWKAAFDDAVEAQQINFRHLREALFLGSDENRQILEQARQRQPRDLGVERIESKSLKLLAKAFLGPFKMAPSLAGNVAAAVGGTLAAGPAGGVGGVVAYNSAEGIGAAHQAISSAEVNGQRVSPGLTRALAIPAGAATGAIYSWGMGPVVKGLAGPLTSKAGAETIKQLLGQPTVTRLVASTVVKYGEHLALGASAMAAGSAINETSKQIAQKVSFQTEFNASEVGAVAKESFVTGLQDMLLLAAHGPGRDALREYGRLRSSTENAARLGALTQAAKDSKLLDRSPEEFQEMAARMKAGGDVQNVRIPSDAWVNYWRSRNADPAEMARTVLGDDGKAFTDAVTTGGDLVIPTEKYLTHLAKTEHATALAADAKLFADEMTPREIATEQRRIETRLQEEAAKAKEGVAPEEPTVLTETHRFLEEVAGDPEALATMSPAELAEFNATLAKAREQAAHEATWRSQGMEPPAEERARIAAEVGRELQQDRTHRAQGVLSGEGVPDIFVGNDGQPLKLNRTAFVEAYGADTARQMPRGAFDTRKASGVTADDLAPLLGFDNGDQMVEAFAKAEPLEQAVSRMTQERLSEKYGPALERLQEQALAAAHTEAALEAAILQHRTYAKDVDPAIARRVHAVNPKALKAKAADIVWDKPLTDLDPRQFSRVERAAALKAAELKGRGEKEAAFYESERRLLNQALFMEARDARAAAENWRRKLEDTSEATRARLGLADPAFRNSHDAIVAAVLEGRQSPGGHEAFETMLKQAEESAQDIAFSTEKLRGLLSEPKQWENLSVGEASEVHDAIVNIRHLAKLRNEVNLAGKLQAKEEFFADVQAHTEKRKAEPVEPLSRKARTVADKLRGLKRGADALLTEVGETYAHMLDAGDRQGPAHRLLIDERLKARDKSIDLAKGVLKQVSEAWENVPKELQKRMNEEVDVAHLLPVPPAFGSRYRGTYTRSDLYQLYLNWGNAGNRQRVMDGNGWMPENVDAALSLLKKSELEFLDGMAQAGEGLYPELARVHEERTGLQLGKVEPVAIEVKTADGQVHKTKGHYWPLKYDARASKQGEVQEGAVVKSIFAPNYVKPSTPASFRKARLEKVMAPVDIWNWDAIPAHFAQVIHDISYGGWVRQAGSLMMDGRWKDTTERYLGKERADEFVPWLRDVANARADSAAGNSARFLGTASSFVRGRIANAAMGWNIKNQLQGLVDPMNASLEGVDPRRISHAYLKVANPENWGAMPEIKLSREIAYRDEKVLQNMRETLEAGSKQKDPLQIATDIGFKGYEAIDAFASRVVFKAAYDQHMSEGFSQAESVSRADDVVRRRFPSHDIAEKPPILRSKKGIGAALMFYSYSNKGRNTSRRAWDDLSVARSDPSAGAMEPLKKVGALVAKYAWVGAVGAISAYVRGQGPARNEDEGEWLMRKALLEPLSGYPVVGPLAEGAVTGKVNARAAPETAFVAEAFERIGDLAEKARKGDIKSQEALWAATEALLFAAGGPSGQARTTASGFRNGGKVKGPLDAASRAIYGKRKDPRKQPRNPLSDLDRMLNGK